MAVRRTLKFESLADAVRDAEHLLANGYDRAGNWDLAQCCGHLANWAIYPMDGYPPLPLLLKPVFWIVRNTMAGKIRRDLIGADGVMKPGLQTAPQSVPAPGGDAAEAVEKLKVAYARWLAHDGPLHPSPLLGLLPRDDITRGHLVHASHHLSFLIPKQA